MQLRYETGLTGEQYVRAEAWRDARLERCPNHPHGGCSLARHATYARKTPPGAKVPRGYCRESHTTISLLADCLAARLAGTLDALEAVVVAAEEAQSLEAAANEVRRPEDDGAVELPGAMRWVRRRVRLVHHVVSLVIGLLPEPLARCIAEMGAVRTRLGTDCARRALRVLTAEPLRALPAPLGFQPHRLGATNRNQARQHKRGLTRHCSQQRALVCAKLGIALIHPRPYQRAGKGNIERFFRTLRAAGARPPHRRGDREPGHVEPHRVGLGRGRVPPLPPTAASTGAPPSTHGPSQATTYALPTPAPTSTTSSSSRPNAA